MRAIAGHPAARGLRDDAAVLAFGGETLVLTHDMMVEGTHWSPGDDPAAVAWKLVAANLSDLAAKGAEPVGMLLGFMLGEEAWDRRFAEGLNIAVAAFDVPLLGGDTVAGGPARALGLTAIGRASFVPVPPRDGARPGDLLGVTGTIGDACAAFRLGGTAPAALREALLRPVPRLGEGKAVASAVRAMMDVSDGLLIDAARMAEASACGVSIDLDAVPLSQEFRAALGTGRTALLDAFAWGDDYQLLAAWPPDRAVPDCLSVIGCFLEGSGLHLTQGCEVVDLPERLGFQHG